MELFSPENERALLACIFKRPERIYEVTEVADEYIFSVEFHRDIFSAMMDMAEPDAKAITEHSVLSRLKATNKITTRQSENYLHEIDSMKINEASFSSYFQLVVDAYKARHLNKISEGIPDMLDRYEGNMEQIVDRVRSTLEILNENNSSHGVSSIEELLKGAWEDILSKKDNPGISGGTTGFPSIDLATGGYEPGDLWIICGRPGHGKTTAMLKSLKESCQRDVTPVLMFSKEMQGERLTKRLLSMESGVEHEKLKTGIGLKDEDMKALASAKESLKSLPLYVDSNFFGDEHYIANTVRRYNKKYGIQIVGIDYIQLIAERSSEQTHELGRISRMLKLLAEDLGITIVVASQLNREVERRENKRPKLSDLRQSGNLEEDADMVIGLYREDQYMINETTRGDIEFIILKQRNGPTGIYTLGFQGSTINIIDRRATEDILFANK